jgi:hypothetical protein
MRTIVLCMYQVCVDNLLLDRETDFSHGLLLFVALHSSNTRRNS